jgi:glutamate synthase (NADPH/NADH) small chain
MYRGCPVGIKIQEFIKLVARATILSRQVKKIILFLQYAGRVCPQEERCEIKCNRKKYEPVAIGRLERFIADYESERWNQNRKQNQKQAGVAIIGRSRAELRRRPDTNGLDVTVFEALHEIGGVLLYD